MKSTLKGNLTQLFCVLFLIVLIIWVVFYFVVSNYIYKQAERQLLTATNQITEDLNREFSDVEKISYQISTWSTVVDFMKAKSLESRINIASEINSVLRGNYNLNFVNDIIAINKDGDFYRFAGNLSNSSCAHLTKLVKEMVLPNHIVVNAISKKRIGYAVGVYDGNGELTGYFIMMTDEDKLHEMMYSHAFEDFLSIGIVADEKLIVANSMLTKRFDEYLLNPNLDDSIVRKQMGLTPFEAIVAMDKNVLVESTIYFSIAATVTLITFAAILLLFVRAMKKLFVSPMLSIMDNAKQIGVEKEEKRLSRTGQNEFDLLVEQINSMISRIDENSKELFQMKYKMQSIEFEKQQAILISLKKQINAHFTVNTLNVVKRFSETGENEKAGIICDGLSSLLRYANGADEFISCREELYMLEQYIDIMSIRYPDSFVVEFDAEEELDDVLLPRMLVQPIVENAISHGLLTSKNGLLTISAKVVEDKLIFKITDNGRGIEKQKLRDLKDKIELVLNKPWGEMGLEHIALPNIQKRVVFMFGENYGLDINSAENTGTTVTITLPAYPNEDE